MIKIIKNYYKIKFVSLFKKILIFFQMRQKSFIIMLLIIGIVTCNLPRKVLDILNEIPESIPGIIKANVETLKNAARSIMFP